MITAVSRPTREQVFQALFARLQTAGATFTTYSRRMMDYSAIPPNLMPIVILWEQPEETEWGHRGTPKDYWEAFVFIVFQNPSRPLQDDPTTATAGATIVNPLIDAVRTALGPDDPTEGELTLDGLVEWVRVWGRTLVETGDTETDGRGGAIIPIRILVP